MARAKRTFGTVRQLPSGRFQALYFYNGQYHKAPMTYRTKSEANAWLAVQAGTIAQGTWSPVSNDPMTVAELAAQWLNSNPLKQESSRDRDRSIVENHIKPSLGQLNITHVTKARCQELVDNWTAKNHLSASTVVRQVAVLHAVFQYAVDDRKRLDNPANKLRLPKEEPAERPYQDLTSDDYDRLAGALGPDDAVMMWLGAETGARWGECAGLTVGDVNLLGATVTISMQLDRKGNRVKTKTRTAGQPLDISQALVDDLAAHFERRRITGADPDTLVFTTVEQNSMLHYSNWRLRVWGPACRKAGLAGLGFHDLRRNNASTMHDVGLPVKVAQERLRHKKSSTTLDIYTKASKRGHKEAAEAIAKRIRPAQGHRATS